MQKTLIGAVLALSCTTMLATAAHADSVPVDLSGWVQEGSGNWVLQPGNDAVRQTQNVNPGVFFNPVNAQGTRLSGTIQVAAGAGDDDFIGFVLGYNAGEISAAADAADYLLIDWKGRDQGGYYSNQPGYTGDGIAKAGLAISHVTRGLNADSGAWLHNPGYGVTELARATNLGSTGWLHGTTYTFDLEFTGSNVKVYVDNALEIDINGSFGDGGFGFYNYSQANVLYAGLTESVLPPVTGAVPEPATWAMLIAGFGMVGFAMRRRQRLASVSA